MFKSIGVPELIIILVIIIIFFGVGKLPQVGESIGKAIRSFKKAQSDDDNQNVPAKTGTKKTDQKKA